FAGVRPRRHPPLSGGPGASMVGMSESESPAREAERQLTAAVERHRELMAAVAVAGRPAQSRHAAATALARGVQLMAFTLTRAAAGGHSASNMALRTDSGVTLRPLIRSLSERLGGASSGTARSGDAGRRGMSLCGGPPSRAVDGFVAYRTPISWPIENAAPCGS